MTASGDPTPPRRRARVTALGVVVLALAFLAAIAPFGYAEVPAARVGGLLAFAAAIEGLHALRRFTPAARRQATTGAAISMAIAVFLITAPFVAAQALRFAIAGWFALDAVRHALAALRRTTDGERTLASLAALGNTTVALWLFLAQGWMVTVGVALAGALRIAGIAWNIMVAPVHTVTEADDTVLDELGLADEPRAVAMAADVEAAEVQRAPIDRVWTWWFIAVLFAIHIGRMSIDFSLLGLLGPAVALLGDMFVAVAITLFVFNPLYLMWRGPTRWVERWVWHRHLRALDAGRTGWIARATGAWLRWRLRFAMRMRAARYSIPTSIGRGLQAGLPFAAILAATVPVWGMSWYFDTENWAAGMWNSWAESRTDTWREAMVRAVSADDRASGNASTRFAVDPPGATGDFSFVVIGDPGEGDASQQVLGDQLLAVANSADVRFVVISSDVVYPTGAMKDYEAKFWLQFKGITRPVYAIPGNHDWYDALEGFAATFLEPAAARLSIRARVEADLRLTSTTDGRIDRLIGQAARLRQAYGVPTGFQRAPFFEIQTERFALLAIDTGILRTIDPAQDAWLDAALTRAAGKTTMAILGHPFFAGGHDVTSGDASFARLKRRLLDRGVTIVMAGDTHDLEYYSDPPVAGSPAVHYFVNGGGGAYLSFGTSLAWPARAPTAEWAHYPNLAAVTAKIDAHTPWWKRPAWWWTRQFGAWPFSAEWLSAAFDYNVAPFFQSFIEVKVEPSAHRVRLIPYGVNGRLTWGEFGYSSQSRDAGANGRVPVEWVVPMSPR